MKICVVQQSHNPGRVGENLSKALAFAKQALDGGSEIVLFHEELLVGYVEDPHALAQSVNGEAAQAFERLLRDYEGERKIIYGLTERCGQRYYISAPVVSREGVVANYRKCHLWKQGTPLRDETRLYTPGEGLVTFRHRGFQAGVMICYDGDFPEMARAYARMGCQMLFWMNNRESRGHDDFAQLHSRCNSLIVATSCCCGKDETGAWCSGKSNIVDYDATLLGELADREGILVAEVHPELVQAHREENPLFGGLREDLFYHA